MKAVRTDATNINLTLPGGTSANDLPAERCYFRDPNDTVDRPDDLGFETTWLPDEREREAVGAGAPILLRVWGAGHPPVSLVVPTIDTDRQAITADHAARAVGALYGALAERNRLPREVQDDERVGAELTAPEFLDIWVDAVERTSDIAMQASAAVDELVDSLQEDRAKRTAPHGDPLSVPCAGCRAGAGEPCNSPKPWVPTVGDICDRQAAQVDLGSAAESQYPPLDIERRCNCPTGPDISHGRPGDPTCGRCGGKV